MPKINEIKENYNKIQTNNREKRLKIPLKFQ